MAREIITAQHDLHTHIVKTLPQRFLIAAALVAFATGVDLPWLDGHAGTILALRGAMVAGTLVFAGLSRYCRSQLAAEAMVVIAVCTQVVEMAFLGHLEGTYLTGYVSAVYQTLTFVVIFLPLRLSVFAGLTIFIGLAWFWGCPLLFQIPVDPRLFASHLVGYLTYAFMVLVGNHMIARLWADEVHLRASLKEHAQALRELATRDGLTGVYNYRHFQEMLTLQVEGADSHARPLCLCMLDLDVFKTINDTMGHSCGNAVLQCVARCTLSMVRRTDVVFRIGGDEFAIILPDTCPADARRVAERIQAVLASAEGVKHETQQQLQPISCSMGIAELTPACATPEALLKAADDALYQAKAAGKGQVVVAGASMLLPV